MTNKKTKTEAQVKDEQYCSDLLETLKTKSSTIRYLTAEGWDRGRISKGMNIIYQHVRNVQVQQAAADAKKAAQTTEQ